MVANSTIPNKPRQSPPKDGCATLPASEPPPNRPPDPDSCESCANLAEAAFAEVVGFTTLLRIHCQLCVERKLDTADSFGGDPTRLPKDLDSDGWIDRIKRLTRFLM